MANKRSGILGPAISAPIDGLISVCPSGLCFLSHQERSSVFTVMSDDIFETLFDFSEIKDDGGVDFCGLHDENAFTCANLSCQGTNFDVDESRGDIVCLDCGACFGGLLVGVLNTTSIADKGGQGKTSITENARSVAFDSIGIRSAKNARHKKDTYRRQAYFRDRLSQWLHTEKPIPKHDLAVIKKEWRRYLHGLGVPGVLPTKAALRKSRGKIISGCHPLEKSDIRSILRACDARLEAIRKKKLAEWPDDPMWKCYRDEIGEQSKSFVKRYLEKWLSLRWRFTGQHSTAAECPHENFDQLQEYLGKLDRSFPACFAGEKRKAFPNWNEVTRNLLQLLFLEHLGGDFPGLRTQRAKNRANYHWWKFCRFHKWPYLLKEARFLKRRKKRE